MIDFTVLFAFIAAVFLFLSTPGPVTIIVMNNSLRQGFIAGLATIAGTNLASLALIAVSFLLLYGVFAIDERWLGYITLFGSLYLLYFAVQIIKDSFRPHLIDSKLGEIKQPNKPLYRYFSQGFLVGISNPKDVLFFVAFFPLFFNVSSNITIAMPVLTLTWVLLDYAILALYSVVFAKIKNTNFIAWTGRISGVVLLLVALFGFYKTLIALFA